MILPVLIFLLSNITITQAYGGNMDKQIRKPAVAGMFYPASPEDLKKKIKDYLDKASFSKIEENIIAIISPHAGYEFSGGVASYGFKAIKGRDFSTVIIIGPSHYVYFEGSSVYPKGYYKTPLADVEIDEQLTEKLINNSTVRFYPPAHQREHSVEVQVPFLQTVLKNFKIVPIVMGNCSYQDCLNLGKAIANNIKAKKTLIIASTDFSHFHTSQEARVLDKISLEEIENFDPQQLYDKLKAGKCQLCGGMPVVTALIISKELGADKIKLLKYLHSGDVTGDNSRVVGYGSLIIQSSEKNRESLSKDEKKRLLAIAREAIETYVLKKQRVEIEEKNSKLREKKGVFVTLTKNGQLRGCIGYIQAVKPLCEAVRDMAIEAAVNDHRFFPLDKTEIDKIRIEISVLSSLKKIKDVSEIKLGQDGIFIKKGFNSGLLLPQVATENNWDRREFLMHTCYKAGLSQDAWKTGAEIYIFSAEIFNEN